MLSAPLAVGELNLPLAQGDNLDKARIKAMQQAVAAVAAEHELPEGLLCARKHLEALLAGRGELPDVVSIALGNGLLLLGFAEMARAARGFQGLPERRLAYWTLVSLVVVALMVFAEGWPHYSARVLVNSSTAMVLLSGMALALCGVAFAGVGAWIFHNTNTLAGYEAGN